ncbi:MAG: ATP-dependent DNA helicase, partial [Chlorobi bacterium]|nr:ATP-dependent DNA helicase [Chlorobiota bacterium]
MTIKELIEHGESKQLELKEFLPSGNAIAKTVISFSNAGGGKIIIGVKNNLEIVGVNESKIFKLEEKISSYIYDLCYPNILPEIYKVNINGKVLLVIEIFRGNLLPYYLKSKGKRNGTFIRIGSTNRLSDENMIFELERQRQGKSFDEEANFEREVNSLNLSVIINEFKRAGKRADYAK